MRIDGRPELEFQFAQQPGRLALSFLGTFLAQAAVVAILYIVGREALQVRQAVQRRDLRDARVLRGAQQRDRPAQAVPDHVEVPGALQVGLAREVAVLQEVQHGAEVLHLHNNKHELTFMLVAAS